MIAEVVAATNSLRAATDLVRAGFNAKVDAEVADFRIKLMDRLGQTQDALFELREKLAEIQEENSKLKNAVASEDTWRERAREYVRKQTPGGAWAFQSNVDSALYVCPTCFEEHRVTPLQPLGGHSGSQRCPVHNVGFQVQPDLPYPEALPSSMPSRNSWMHR